MRTPLDEAITWNRNIVSCSRVNQSDLYDPKRPPEVEAPQATNAEGVPLWELTCTYTDDTGRFGAESEILVVRVAAHERPEVPEGGCLVWFDSPVQNTRERTRGGYSRSYSADAVHVGDAVPAARVTAIQNAIKKLERHLADVSATSTTTRPAKSSENGKELAASK